MSLCTYGTQTRTGYAKRLLRFECPPEYSGVVVLVYDDVPPKFLSFHLSVEQAIEAHSGTGTTARDSGLPRSSEDADDALMRLVNEAKRRKFHLTDLVQVWKQVSRGSPLPESSLLTQGESSDAEVVHVVEDKADLHVEAEGLIPDHTILDDPASHRNLDTPMNIHHLRMKLHTVWKSNTEILYERSPNCVRVLGENRLLLDTRCKMANAFGDSFLATGNLRSTLHRTYYIDDLKTSLYNEGKLPHALQYQMLDERVRGDYFRSTQRGGITKFFASSTNDSSCHSVHLAADFYSHPMTKVQSLDLVDKLLQIFKPTRWQTSGGASKMRDIGLQVQRLQREATFPSRSMVGHKTGAVKSLPKRSEQLQLSSDNLGNLNRHTLRRGDADPGLFQMLYESGSHVLVLLEANCFQASLSQRMKEKDWTCTQSPGLSQVVCLRTASNTSVKYLTGNENIS
eukprot:1926586-Amphidinium_carterae.4